jgi:predicted aspartyl protease
MFHGLQIRRFAVAAAAFCIAVSASACAKTPEPDQIIPLDVSGIRPTAMLTIGTHAPVKVIFDSGAGTTVINRALASELGLPNDGETSVGSPGATRPVMAMITSIEAARLGDASIRNGRAVAMELPPRLAEYGGVVSPHAFDGRLVRFEFAKSRVVITDKTTASLPAGEPVPYGGEAVQPLPAATIDVAGLRTVALLDSGAKGGLTLPIEFAKQIPLKGPLVPTEPFRLVGGDHAAFTATVNGIVHIGPLTLTDPAVMFVEGHPPFGNVGFQLLKGLTLVLDPEERRSWLLPGG